MDVTHRVANISKDLRLFLSQLPTFTLGAVGAVVSAAAANKELWLRLM